MPLRFGDVSRAIYRFYGGIDALIADGSRRLCSEFTRRPPDLTFQIPHMKKIADQNSGGASIDRRTFLGALGASGLVAAATQNNAGAADQDALLVNLTGPSVTPLKEWKMQSATKLDIKGDAPPAADAAKWYPVTVPCTVLAGLVENGEYPNLYFGENLKQVPTDRFNGAWWYRNEFKAPPDSAGNQVWLYFKGINYRANIWLNGKKIGDAKDVVGTYRDFEFNISDTLDRSGNNVLLVEVQPPKKNDLAITFVDWAPKPPDQNMGLWQEVELRTSGALALRHAMVQSELDVPSLKSARLTVMVDVVNARDKPTNAIVKATIFAANADRNQQHTASCEVKLGAGVNAHRDLYAGKKSGSCD